MTTAQVLKSALELLGPNGEHWTKGEYGIGKKLCALQALRQASTAFRAHDIAIWMSRHVLGQPLWLFNDDRTFAEVKEAFLKAIQIAERENA